MTNKIESEEDVLLKEKTLLENDYSFEIRFSKFTNTFQSKAGSYITVLKMSVKPNQILDFISFEKRVSYQQGFEAGKIVEKDTNSQDSIQVGNESIQTTLSVEKEEICGVIVSSNRPQMKDGHACFNLKPCPIHSIPQSNTLGTTMEERLKEFVLSVTYGGRGNDMDDTLPVNEFEKLLKTFINKELTQSKTDLFNALIEREYGEEKEIITEHPTTTVEFLEEGQILGYNQAKIDTINHLKSLRDE